MKNSQEFGVFGREQVVYLKDKGEQTHPRKGGVVPPQPLDGCADDGLPRVLVLAPTRELWVMRRSSAEPLPALVVPSGVRIRSYAPGDDRALLAVNAAAFAQHPEQGTLDLAGLAARMAQPWFDPSGLLLAVDDADRLLGFHWTKRHDDTAGRF